jgi:hypothetical protein
MFKSVIFTLLSAADEVLIIEGELVIKWTVLRDFHLLFLFNKSSSATAFEMIGFKKIRVFKHQFRCCHKHCGSTPHLFKNYCCLAFQLTPGEDFNCIYKRFCDINTDLSDQMWFVVKLA